MSANLSNTSTLHDHNARSHAEVAPGEIAVGVIVGRTSEYFDFFVYGIASALIFPSVFFPHLPKLDATLYSFAIFALAFLSRPLGTMLFLWIQRRWGRGTKLTVAMFLLGTCTAGIAFLPGYAELGMASIVLLAIFRLGQGLALGGSWDGLPSLLALNAPKNKRGWYAMLGQLGAPAGFIVAASLFAFIYASLPIAEVLEWGWRFPFFAAFAINVVALFARLRLVVTEEYARGMDEHVLEPVRVSEVVRAKGRYIAIAAVSALASYAMFHVVTIFPLSWINIYSNESIPHFLGVQVIGGFLACLGVIGSGYIADRLNRRRTLGALAVAIAAFSGFAPTLLGAGQGGQYAFILIGFLLLGLSYGQAAGALNANFGERYRYTGAAISNDIAWLIGAAFAPLIVLSLCAKLGLEYVGAYLLSGAVATLLALGFNRWLRQRQAATGVE